MYNSFKSISEYRGKDQSCFTCDCLIISALFMNNLKYLLKISWLYTWASMYVGYFLFHLYMFMLMPISQCLNYCSSNLPMFYLHHFCISCFSSCHSQAFLCLLEQCSALNPYSLITEFLSFWDLSYWLIFLLVMSRIPLILCMMVIFDWMPNIMSFSWLGLHFMIFL